MLHGIIAFCGRSGGLYYSKAFSPNFGLELQSGLEKTDPHNLSSLLFALQLNAQAVSRNAPDSSDQPSLRSVEMGPVSILFQRPAKCRRLIVALFVHDTMVSGASYLIKDIAERLHQKYQPVLESETAGVRKFSGASAIVNTCLTNFADYLLRDAAASITTAGRLRWILAASSAPAADKPERPARRPANQPLPLHQEHKICP